MKKIFLGPPGSGKGTYSKRISPIRNVPHISTGDLFIENIKSETELGKKVKDIISRGELVPDEIVIEMLKKRIFEKDCEKGFILDGFPRTIEQAKVLQGLKEIDVVLNLVIPEDILIEKICARRVCGNCGDIYNIADIDKQGIKMPPMNPKEEGKCDKCGGKLIQREDDNEKTVKDRLETYKKETRPLIDFYKNLGILKGIRITSSPEIMVPEILGMLEEFEKKLLKN
jgi:adenylate kinase